MSNELRFSSRVGSKEYVGARLSPTSEECHQEFIVCDVLDHSVSDVEVFVEWQKKKQIRQRFAGLNRAEAVEFAKGILEMAGEETGCECKAFDYGRLKARLNCILEHVARIENLTLQETQAYHPKAIRADISFIRDLDSRLQ